ncbi:hypothetical protein NC652_022096 [Populus alba x Populus x berolinensis]|nr:hypothetical protein NC652_022096 [Populus alba x Populus x berolinensis]
MYWKKKQCSITSALYREKCSIIVELAVLERYILLVVSVTNIPGLIIEYPVRQKCIAKMCSLPFRKLDIVSELLYLHSFWKK